MPNVWWMPIQTRTEMLATGVRSPLGIEVFGDDLDAIERTAIAVEHALAAGPGNAQRVRRALDGGLLPRLRREARRGGAARPQRRRREHGRRPVHRRREHLRGRGGARALPHQRPLRARVPRRSRAPRAHARRDPVGRADPAVAGGRHPERPRTADDPERRRKARRLRLRRHRPADRGLRRRREEGRRPRRADRPGRAARMGRPVPVLRARQASASSGSSL